MVVVVVAFSVGGQELSQCPVGGRGECHQETAAVITESSVCAGAVDSSSKKYVVC